MRAWLLSLCLVAAPVPRHLFPPEPPHPVRPGFRWYYQTYLLEATHVEGDRVRYRCLNRPAMRWGRNEQSRATCYAEAMTYGVPRQW